VLIEKLLLSVGAAQFEIVQRESCFETEPCRLIIGRCRLRLFLRGGDAAAKAAPQVHVAGKIEGQPEISLAGTFDESPSKKSEFLTGARRGGDGWELRSPIEANRCASFAEPRFRYFQRLVAARDLLFQLVEFRIARNLPPAAATCLIRRLSRFPLI